MKNFWNTLINGLSLSGTCLLGIIFFVSTVEFGVLSFWNVVGGIEIVFITCLVVGKLSEILVKEFCEMKKG